MKMINFMVALFLLLFASCATYQQADNDDDFTFDSDKPGWTDGAFYLLDISTELDSLLEGKVVEPKTVAMYNKYLDYRPPAKRKLLLMVQETRVLMCFRINRLPTRCRSLAATFLYFYKILTKRFLNTQK
jgi:hypothetical protein